MSVLAGIPHWFAGVPAIFSLLFLAALPARADEAALTRARIVELVREAPASRVASSEAAVASAAVTVAGTLSLDNPVLSGMGGIRFNPDGRRPFSGVATLSWPVDLGGKGSARVEAAKAEERGAVAAAEDSRRQVLLAALLQHALVLRDERQVALAAERLTLAQRLAAAAEKHRKAGGVPESDVVLATLQQRRDTASEMAARGVRDADKLVLASLLGLSLPGPSVAGTLVPADVPPPVAVLLREIEQRTDIRAAEASLDAAGARAERERAAQWPTLSILAQYERDDGANIGMLGLAIPLPLLNPNRTGVATSTAEAKAAQARLLASRTNAAGQIRALYARYLATKAALETLAPTAGLAAQAVALSARGYELGENDLATVTLARREANDTQAALLEVEHAHANAKIELLVAAGRSPQ